MLEKLQGLRAEVAAITDSGNREAPPRVTKLIRIPRRMKELLTPIPYIVPAQLFAACLADQKGLDPDRPRTLQKITQTL